MAGRTPAGRDGDRQVVGGETAEQFRHPVIEGSPGGEQPLASAVGWAGNPAVIKPWTAIAVSCGHTDPQW